MLKPKAKASSSKTKFISFDADKGSLVMASLAGVSKGMVSSPKMMRSKYSEVMV